jgi:hypothetical protein
MTKEQALVAKVAAEADEKYAWAKNFNWDTLSRGCEGQLQLTSSTINSQAFSKILDEVINAASKKLKSGYVIYLPSSTILIASLKRQDILYWVSLDS